MCELNIGLRIALYSKSFTAIKCKFVKKNYKKKLKAKYLTIKPIDSSKRKKRKRENLLAYLIFHVNSCTNFNHMKMKTNRLNLI